MAKRIGSLGRWIRTSDRVPEHPLAVVLFLDAAHSWIDIGNFRDGRWLTASYSIPARYVTHWQPLAWPVDLTAMERHFDEDVARTARPYQPDRFRGYRLMVGEL